MNGYGCSENQVVSAYLLQPRSFGTAATLCQSFVRSSQKVYQDSSHCHMTTASLDPIPIRHCL